MRADGSVTYYLIQHRFNVDHWVESSLDYFLFNGLSFDDNRGEVGDRYRALTQPQSANSPLWQRFGIHGYIHLDDADATLQALRERHPEDEFRVVRRSIAQHTEVMP